MCFGCGGASASVVGRGSHKDMHWMSHKPLPSYFFLGDKDSPKKVGRAKDEKKIKGCGDGMGSWVELNWIDGKCAQTLTSMD